MWSAVSDVFNKIIKASCRLPLVCGPTTFGMHVSGFFPPSFYSDNVVHDWLVSGVRLVSSREFLAGILVGNVVLVVLLCLFVDLFLLKRIPRHKATLPHMQQGPSESFGTDAKMRPASPRPRSNPFRNIAEETKAAGTVEWLDFVLGRLIQTCSVSRSARLAMLKAGSQYVNSIRSPWLGEVQLEDLHIVLRDLSISDVVICSQDGALKFHMNSSHVVTLSLSTELLVHYPVMHSASLPVSLQIALHSVSGTMFLGYDDEQSLLTLAFGGDVDFVLEIESELGHTSRLSNVPKVSQLVDWKIREFVNVNMKVPHFISIPLS